MEPAAVDGERHRQGNEREHGHAAVLRRFRRGERRAFHPLPVGLAQLGAPRLRGPGPDPTPPLREPIEEPGRERHRWRRVEEQREGLARIGLALGIGAVVVVDERVAEVLGRQRQVVRDQRVEHPAGEQRPGVRAQPLLEQIFQPDGGEEQERREDGQRVVVELRRREGEHGEADQEPEEEEEHRAIARGLRAQVDARHHRRGAGEGEHPGEGVEADLLDEVGEGPAWRRGVHPDGEALEVVMDDEALEEGLALLVAAVEGEHGAVPGRADGEDDEGAGGEVQAAQAVPLAGGDAVDERHGAGKREAEQALGESGETDEAVEGRRPARTLAFLEQNDHQAGHRSLEQADEDRVGHGLAREEDEERAGEQGDGAEDRGAAAEQAVRHHENEDGAHRDEGGVGEAHAPLGVDAGPALGAVGVGGEHAGRHQPEIERGLAEEPGRLPPGMDVVAARDHLAGHLAVVRLPGIPEAGGAEPGDEEERGEGYQREGETDFGGERLEPAQPGDVAQEAGERVAPIARRLVGGRLRRLGDDFLLRARHRRIAP